jgi:uncharacterized protein YegL
VPTNRSLEEAVDFPYNPEPQLPCVLLLDTSGSMEGQRIDELNAGLWTFKQQLMQDPVARKRVYVALVTFNSRVEVIEQFSPRLGLATQFVSIADFNPPVLQAIGQTFMAKGIKTALDLLQAHKRSLREQEWDYYRPCVFMITDGHPEGEENSLVVEAGQRVRAEESGKRILFYAVGVGGADLSRVRDLCAREPVDLKGRDFGEAIAFLSRSISTLSQQRAGGEDQIAMPLPGSEL